MNATRPADQFYWAILDRSVLPRSARHAPEQLGYLFESRLPVPIDSIHAAYTSIDDARVLAVGAPVEFLNEVDLTNVLTLTPDELPAWLDDGVRAQVDVDSVNFLTGPWTPLAVRRGRRRLAGWTAAIAVACAGLLVVSFERQRHVDMNATTEVLAATMDVYADILGESVRATVHPRFPAEQRLIAAHRRLMQTRSRPIEMQDERIDAALLLTAIIERWPTARLIQTETISVTNGAVTLVLHAPSLEDVQPIADAFADLPGWQVTQPQTVARKDHVDITLRFTREGAAS